jgi:heptaprenyl diphosphate synthase
MKTPKTAALTKTALLTAAALIVYVIESQIPPLTPVPGIKLGLSNIFTLFALYTLGAGESIGVLLVRIVLGGLLTAQPIAIIYSLSGAAPSFLLALLCYKRTAPGKIWVLSAACAVIHNLGQLLTAIIITSTKELIVYLPVLIISGIITGVFTGLCAQFVLSRLGKHFIKINTTENKEDERSSST